MSLNNFYKITSFIKTLLTDNEEVSTVVFGRTEDKDLYKKSLYPLVHVNPRSAPLQSSNVTLFSFEIAVMDQRDLSTTTVDYDKYEGQDNLVDNLNTTYSIINRFITELRLTNNADYIELESVSDATPIIFKDHNLLDGWLITVTLQMPNNLSIC